jgi:PTS system mannose-specific IIB component/fructoselysine and glucoselysine-specific PTS system IIB component
MPLALFRIDDRLIHGQVIVGWGIRLGIDHYVVVDDAIAGSAWEQELYAGGLGPDIPIQFVSGDDAVRRFAELDGRTGRGALLTRDTGSMRILAESGCLDGRRVNVGGIHDGPGRARILDYVCLGERERADLRTIALHAEEVSARDLPTAPRVPLDALLAR